MDDLSYDEFTRLVYEKINLLNIKNAVHGEPAYTIKEMLSAKNITSLKKLGSFYKVPKYSRMGKVAIIPAIADKITNPDILAEILITLMEEDWDLFRQAVAKKHIVDDKSYNYKYHLLLHLGIIGYYYFDDHFYYIVPTEIQNVYTELEKHGFTAYKEHSDLLNGYAVAAANLYGIILMDDFVEIFNSQNERKTDADEAYDLLNKYTYFDYGYCFRDEYIINEDFEELDFDEIDNFIKISSAKRRYVPDKDELLNYSDWDYVEDTPQLNQIRLFLEGLSDGAEWVDEVVDDFYFLSREEARMQEYADILDDKGIDLDLKKMKMLTYLLVELQNNSRLWINNGYTPNELSKMDKTPKLRTLHEPIRIVKIGRNERCPCGSGKKYKNCCGAETE